MRRSKILSNMTKAKFINNMYKDVYLCMRKYGMALANVKSIMKKLILIAVMAVTLAGCAALKSNAPDYRKMMVGNWTLDDISVEGQDGQFKATLFNEAPLSCFKGGSWTLTRPNSLGTYTLNMEAGCPEGLQRDIRWTIYKTETGERQFQFKRLDTEMEPMDNNTGFRLNILSIDETGMTLQDEVEINGQPLYLVYTFSRAQPLE